MTHEEAQTRMHYVIGRLFFLDALMTKLQEAYGKLCDEEAALLNEFPTLNLEGRLEDALETQAS